MSDELAEVPAKVERRGGARPGCGRPMDRAKRSRQLELMRDHGRRSLMVAIRRLSSYLTNPDSKIDEFYLSTFKDLADRCGLARGVVVAATDATGLTPDMVSEAVQRAGERIAEEPDGGEVLAVCADFEIIKPSGNGEPSGTVQ